MYVTFFKCEELKIIFFMICNFFLHALLYIWLHTVTLGNY